MSEDETDILLPGPPVDPHDPSVIHPLPRAVITRIGPITGPDRTGQFGMPWTDDGISARTPHGRTLLFFGDTFSGEKPPPSVEARYLGSPFALYAATGNLNDGVTFDGAIGGSPAQQLLHYTRTPWVHTILPSDVITVDDRMYLFGLTRDETGFVVRTGIWRSGGSDTRWERVAQFPACRHAGLFQSMTWAQDEDDGYIYIFSSSGDRTGPFLILRRVHRDHIGDPGRYETRCHREGLLIWSTDPNERPANVLDGKFGEMSLRQFDGKWVFTFAQFERGGSIDGIVLGHPTSDLRTAHRRTLIRNTASESTEDGTHLSHLYGGYIIAGSTLDELHLAVSQWDDHRYQVVQFRVEGITRPG